MALNYSAINNIYNYYLTTYAPKSDTKFDTHKKSELRGVYNSIVKINKEAPLYIVDKTAETREYAIGLKENARTFRNILASLGGLEDSELLNKKVAFSSDESVVSAGYIGAYDEIPRITGFEISVNHLASVQVNEGKMLEPDGKAIGNGAYSFDIAINGLDYEFQYNVVSADTNKSIQDKLARLISSAGIGIRADVVSNGNGKSALRIESVSTGSANGGVVFAVSDDNTSQRSGSVATFGLDNIVQKASDSEIIIDGQVMHTSGNTFAYEQEYELTLNKATEPGESVKIGLRADSESLVENIGTLIEAYNGFLDTIDSYTERHPQSNYLSRELKELARVYEEPLTNLGIALNNRERLEIAEEKLRNGISVTDGNNNLNGLKKFAGSVLRKSYQVSLNPMQYVDKRIVSYKNPGKNYATPYATSAYTGMMFNSYC